MNSARAYRSVAAESTTHIGLLIATYDAIAEDLRLAGVAAGKSDIAERCRRSQHAMLLLGHLESWVPLLNEKPLEVALTRFYEYVRAEILRLQTATEATGFSELAMRICETRAVWQKKQENAVPTTPARVIDPPDTESTNMRLCWSA